MGAASRGASTAAKWAVGRGEVFCAAIACRLGALLLASASSAPPHLPSCIARSRHTLRLAFHANDALVRGLVSARRSRGARRRKTFSEVVQSAVDRFSASPYSPPTHDGHTTASNNSRGMEAAKVLPFQETSNLPTLRQRSSDRKSISHHHTHKEHVSGSIVSGETTVSLTSTLAAAPRSTEASPRFESLPGVFEPDTSRKRPPRRASVIASNRSRKGFRVLCPPGT